MLDQELTECFEAMKVRICLCLPRQWLCRPLTHDAARYLAAGCKHQYQMMFQAVSSQLQAGSLSEGDHSSTAAARYV